MHWRVYIVTALLTLHVSPVLAASAPVCKGANGYADAFAGRRIFLMRPEVLSASKAKGTKDPALEPAWKHLFSVADAALAGPVYSVVNKTRVPPSGDKHDYMSMGPYWWPDTKQPKGEPYIRRDGEVNPERSTSAFDVDSLEKMSASVEALSLAYYLSDDRRYALKAAELVRVWYLAPATRMNPNASFAQGVPGRTPGRAEGVLDTYRMMRVIEGVGLLAPAKVLSATELESLEGWFDRYTTWMMTSPTGKEERAAENNHALWYDYQLAHFALFARRENIAREVLKNFTEQRLMKQIETDGKMPRELGRTRAYHYTMFALQAATGLADVGQCLQVDLWQGPGRERLKAALSYVASFVGRERDFPYPDLKPTSDDDALEVFARAAWAYDDMQYRHAAATSAQYNRSSDLILTIAPP